MVTNSQKGVDIHKKITYTSIVTEMITKKGEILNLIKKKREKLHLSQEQLAKRVGVAQITIWKYEKYLRFPKMSILSKLCEVLDIPIEEIYKDFNKKRKE